MKRTIKVYYTGPSNEDLDNKITEAIEALGGKWYAQGYTIADEERDIAFDYEDPNDDEK